ncbi:unnamed protein product [Cyprideis torosa]|uniref:Uncharacterized protein n=1 Tax=Cyprideis torosa TaxID=163714 RepID=A0A7R8ZJY8_9CRUS|nr:unnamed protein product [Cyprideis torosa]CAG0879218.1 unnamed protein product [Cyprideis torosa]
MVYYLLQVSLLALVLGTYVGADDPPPGAANDDLSPGSFLAGDDDKKKAEFSGDDDGGDDGKDDAGEDKPDDKPDGDDDEDKEKKDDKDKEEKPLPPGTEIWIGAHFMQNGFRWNENGKPLGHLLHRFWEQAQPEYNGGSAVTINCDSESVKPHLKRHERSAGNSSFYSDGVWYHCAPPFKPHFYTCIHIVKKVHLPFFEANQFCKYLPSSEEYKSGLLKVENPEQIKLLTNHLKKNYGDCGEVKGHKIDGEESEISDPWIGVCYTYDDFRWNSNDQLVHTFNWVGNHSTIQSGGVALNCEEK